MKNEKNDKVKICKGIITRLLLFHEGRGKITKTDLGGGKGLKSFGIFLEPNFDF